jgi:hypothetical protein
MAKKTNKAAVQKPRPDLFKGDLVTTSFRPLFYDIPKPATVVDVRECFLCLDGWEVAFLDTNGVERSINSGYFTKQHEHGQQ